MGAAFAAAPTSATAYYDAVGAETCPDVVTWRFSKPLLPGVVSSGTATVSYTGTAQCVHAGATRYDAPLFPPDVRPWYGLFRRAHTETFRWVGSCEQANVVAQTSNAGYGYYPVGRVIGGSVAQLSGEWGFGTGTLDTVYEVHTLAADATAGAPPVAVACPARLRGTVVWTLPWVANG